MGSKIDTVKGFTIIITCNVNGVPIPVLNWTKDGQDISPDERVVLLESNGRLVIRDSVVEDSGNYTCTASSRAGQASSTSLVTVSGKPVTLVNSPFLRYSRPRRKAPTCPREETCCRDMSQGQNHTRACCSKGMLQQYVPL